MTDAAPIPLTICLLKVEAYWQSLSTSALKTSALICWIASLVKSEKGSATALGEIPWPSRPISFMDRILAGAWKLRCFAGSNWTGLTPVASSIRDWGIELEGRVARLVAGPTTSGGAKEGIATAEGILLVGMCFVVWRSSRF